MRKFAAPALFLAAIIAAPSLAATLSYKGPYAKVEYRWSKEAAAVPSLDQRFRHEFAREKARFIAGGGAEYRDRLKSGYPGVGWESSVKVETRGQSARLLSLARSRWAFTGGAHGNGGTTALLWDRLARREIAFADLFLKAGSFESLAKAPYCSALDRERANRRGGDGKLGNGVSEFDACPAFGDLALMPGDANRNGRFDQIEVNAAPYVAGPYAEGDYVIRLPVTLAMIAAMKPAYRTAFEAQQ